MADLPKILAEVRRRIANAPKRGLNEQNTKATLIEPVLRALGWDVENVEEVQREFRIKKRDKPVDYGLLILRTPRLFIEAKALGSNLDDRRWANQIMGYATVAGVEWMVLTDGDEYRIYNTHAPVAVDEKLFRKVRVTNEEPLVAKTIELLAKDRLGENRIEVLWRAQFVDHHVRAALEELFSPDSDMLLVNYVGGRMKSLAADEVRASLARCHVSIDFPEQLDLLPPAPEPKRKVRPRKGTGKARKKPKTHSVAVTDLIQAGLLTPGTKLQARYKGKILSARIERDGRIRVARTIHNSLSIAGGAARAKVIGLREDGSFPATNGWAFWKVETPGGNPIPIAELRQQYLSEGGAAETAG